MLMKFKLLIMFAVITMALGGIGGSYFAISSNLPSIEELKQYTPAKGTKIYADDDTFIGELKIEKGVYVVIENMPQDLINAIVSVEDARFWRHKGLDYIAIVRALIKDLIHVSLKEGGSTITQQLAKVVYLSPKKTFKRKVMEAFLAIKLENNLSKEEILELYLNKIYFGHGAYGVEMASQTYFGKSVKNLNLAEASLIAGLTKAPSTYSPYNNLEKAKTRQKIVLMRMVEEEYITAEDKEQIYEQPLYLSNLKRSVGVNSYFIEYIRKQLEETYGIDTVYNGDLKVYTTLDREMQSAAVNALQAGLREIDRRRGWRGPVGHKEDIDIDHEVKSKQHASSVVVSPGDVYSGLVLSVTKKEALIKTRGVIGRLSARDASWASSVLDSRTGKTRKLRRFSLQKTLKPGDIVKVSIKQVTGKRVRLALEQDPEVEGALVAVEPYTGFIKAMVGGYDFKKSEYNRAIFAERQPGSAFKPVIYAAAMDSGYTPASIIVDEPVTYMEGQSNEWSPENYDHEYHGPTRLREALVYSRNIVTVKLADEMGLDVVINYANQLGFKDAIPKNLSIALGSFTTTPLEMASVYNVFASNGLKLKPLSMKYIVDPKGRILESSEPAPEQVISPQTSFLITSMMEDVVAYGTGWRAKALARPVAGKTGTTNDYKDAWFAGYSSSLTACVWVGFDDLKTLGPKETGAKAASPIWVAFMNNALKEKTEEFIPPEGIVRYVIDPETGLLSYYDSGIEEYFKEETQPKQFSPTQSIWELRDPSKLNFD
jgi:penicillin-binding protein 1A